MKDFKIFAGNSNPDFARRIAHDAGVDLGHCEIGRFADGEVHVIRGSPGVVGFCFEDDGRRRRAAGENAHADSRQEERHEFFHRTTTKSSFAMLTARRLALPINLEN